MGNVNGDDTSKGVLIRIHRYDGQLMNVSGGAGLFEPGKKGISWRWRWCDVTVGHPGREEGNAKKKQRHTGNSENEKSMTTKITRNKNIAIAVCYGSGMFWHIFWHFFRHIFAVLYFFDFIPHLFHFFPSIFSRIYSNICQASGITNVFQISFLNSMMLLLTHSSSQKLGEENDKNFF